jgi:hypothetical protein
MVKMDPEKILLDIAIPTSQFNGNCDSNACAPDAFEIQTCARLG